MLRTTRLFYGSLKEKYPEKHADMEACGISEGRLRVFQRFYWGLFMQSI